MLSADLLTATRTDAPYWVVLPGLLEERSMSLRALHERSGVALAVLWRGMRPEEKAPRRPEAKATFHPLNADHLRRVSAVLGLDEGYFCEVRVADMQQRMASNLRLCNALYDDQVARAAGR